MKIKNKTAGHAGIACFSFALKGNRAGSPHFKIVRFKWWEHVTTNQYLERGLLTGITRVSKESIFSDLNNLEVVTTTSEKYSSSFSFREGQQGQEKSQKHRPHITITVSEIEKEPSSRKRRRLFATAIGGTL